MWPERVLAHLPEADESVSLQVGAARLTAEPGRLTVLEGEDTWSVDEASGAVVHLSRAFRPRRWGWLRGLVGADPFEHILHVSVRAGGRRLDVCARVQAELVDGLPWLQADAPRTDTCTLMGLLTHVRALDIPTATFEPEAERRPPRQALRFTTNGPAFLALSLCVVAFGMARFYHLKGPWWAWLPALVTLFVVAAGGGLGKKPRWRLLTPRRAALAIWSASGGSLLLWIARSTVGAAMTGHLTYVAFLLAGVTTGLIGCLALVLRSRARRELSGWSLVGMLAAWFGIGALLGTVGGLAVDVVGGIPGGPWAPTALAPVVGLWGGALMGYLAVVTDGSPP